MSASTNTLCTPCTKKGNLALSRALGDFEFKQNTSLTAEEQAVTANPDIIERQLLDSDEFVIVACDGEKFDKCDLHENGI